MTKRALIRSYGCQMNVYDAAKMADILAAEGYDETNDVEQADIVLLNTCHIREHASEKVYSELGRLARLKAEKTESGRTLTIAVAGCVAQAEGSEIVRRQPKVDLVIGPQAYHRLPSLLREAAKTPGVVDTSFPEDDKFGHLPAPPAEKTRARGVSAFLTIQEGCDKFCSFCVVPYTRGAESSRRPESILEEARRLTDAGVVELTLLGQNVNGYGFADAEGQKWGLTRLIEAIGGSIRPLRIRYTTSHPSNMSDDLIEAHRSVDALMPFIHLPVQSGSDRILGQMNRRHTACDYLRLVDKMRSARPDIALSSDFIVGYPGESEIDFELTLKLIADVGFANAFSFKYSPRHGTPAAESADQTPDEVKRERLVRIQELLDAQRRAFNLQTVGAERDVLFEKRGLHPGQIVGKTPHMQAVHAMGSDDLIGRVERVKILDVGSNSLVGRVLDTEGAVA